MKSILSMIFALSLGTAALAEPVSIPLKPLQSQLLLLQSMGEALESELFTGPGMERTLAYLRTQYPEIADIEADGILAIIIPDEASPYVNIALVKDGTVVFIIRALTPEQYQRARAFVLGDAKPLDPLDAAYDGIVTILRIMNSQGGIANVGR